MTTTQMLIQMGSQIQAAAPKQPSKAEGPAAGKEGASAFQNMLEKKQNETAAPETALPQEDNDQPTAEQTQALGGLFVLPMQMVLPQEGMVRQAEVPLVTLPAEGAVLAQPQGQAQGQVPTQPQEESVLSNTAAQQGQFRLLPEAGTQTAPAEEGAVLAQPQQKTGEVPVQTIQAGSQQDGESQNAAPQNGKSAAQKPLPQAEVTQQQMAPMGEQPLFRQVEAAPVKVGQPVPLDTQAKDFDAQAAKAIANALQKGEQRVELKLSPANLGTVTVELTRTAEGVLHVVLTAEREHALKLLTEHAGYLGSLLQNNNQSEVRIEVPQSQQGRQPWQQDGQGQQQQRQSNPHQQQSSQEEQESFLQQLRLGLVHTEELD